MSDIKLKIRHAKRGNERQIDLSGMGLIELPQDINQLTNLESINVSGNRLTSLRGIEALQDLREINAKNNNIGMLHEEFQELEKLESLNLVGNPIVNQNPQLSLIVKNGSQVQDALYDYFSGMSGAGFGGSGSQSAANLNSDAMGGSGGLGGSFNSQRVAGGFLSRQEKGPSADPSSQFERLDINNNSMRQGSFGAAALGGSGGGDRDWMNFASSSSASRANLGTERP